MAKRKKKMSVPTPVAGRGAPQQEKQSVQMTMMDYLTTGTNNSASRTRPSSSRDVPSTTPARRKTSVNSGASSTPVSRSTRRSHASSAPHPTTSTSARKTQLIVISSSSDDDESDLPVPPPSKRRKMALPPTPPVTSRAASEPPISTRSVTMPALSSSHEAVINNQDANNDTPRASKIPASGATGDASPPAPFPGLQSRTKHIPSQMENSGFDPPTTSAVPHVPPEITYPSIFRFPSQRQQLDGDDVDDEDDIRIPPPTLDEYDLDEVPSSQTQLLNPAHMPNLFPSRPPSSSTSFPFTSSGAPSFSTVLTPRKKNISHDSLVSSSQTPETLRVSDSVLFADAFGKPSSAIAAFASPQGSPSRMGPKDNSRFIALRQGRTHSSQPTFAIPFPVTPTRKAKLSRRESRSRSVSLVLTPGHSVEVTAAASLPSRHSHTLDREIEGMTATLRSLNPDALSVPSSPVPSDSGSQTQSVPLPWFPSPPESQPRVGTGGGPDFLDEGSPTQDEVRLDMNNVLEDSGSLTQDDGFRGTSLPAASLPLSRDRDQEGSERENDPLQSDRDGSPRRHEYRLATESLYEESLRFTHFFGLESSPSRDVQVSGRAGDHYQDSLHQFDNRELPARSPPSGRTHQRGSSEENMPSPIKTLLYSESYEASLDKYILETQASQIMDEVEC